MTKRRTRCGKLAFARGKKRAILTMKAFFRAGNLRNMTILVANDEPTNEIIVARAEGLEQVIYNPSEVIDQQLQAPADAFRANVTRLSETTYELTVTATSYTRDLFSMVDKVDPQAQLLC